MTSLGDERGRAEIRERIAGLRADAARRWGKMSAHQMLVHLRDAYEVGLGRRAATPIQVPRAVVVPVKWLALHTALRWSKNSPTMPEVDQFKLGTRPAEFEQDRAALQAVAAEFAGRGEDFAWPKHPFFGPLSARDWLRWGYLHADHHLRQFGA